jgi:hypothetical protein
MTLTDRTDQNDRSVFDAPPALTTLNEKLQAQAALRNALSDPLMPPTPPRPPVAPLPTSSVSVTPAAPKPAMPKPAPQAPAESSDPYGDKGSALSRLPKLPFELLLAMIIGMILLAVVLVVTRGSLSDAKSERDAERAKSAQLDQQLRDANANLEAATAANAELEAAGAETQQEIDERAAALEALQTQITELQAANDELQAKVDAAPTAEPSASPAPVAAPVWGDPFAQALGEYLASADGVRINSSQSTCLGRTVVDDIGLDAVGIGVSTSRTKVTNDVLIDAMASAATACNIDPNLVFGR